jgi:hypothetical protein
MMNAAERMIEHCADSHVTVPLSSYDMATHYLAFANMVSMQVSVAVQSVCDHHINPYRRCPPLPAGQTVDVYATGSLQKCASVG